MKLFVVLHVAAFALEESTMEQSQPFSCVSLCAVREVLPSLVVVCPLWGRGAQKGVPRFY